MKRFILKTVVLFILAVVIPFMPQLYSSIHYDTFNVFHWNNIRFTTAEPNKNYIKTKYILANPKKFNAFIFGSSRVNNIPPDGLPKSLNGKKLNWYNMTSSIGTPDDHLMTIKTFLKNNIKMEFVIVQFDEIVMHRTPEQQKSDLLRMPYQIYDKNKVKFFLPYLKTKVDDTIITQIKNYEHEKHELQTKWFYDYGTGIYASNFSLTENIDPSCYEIGHPGYSRKEAYKDIENIAILCKNNNINLILLTTPMHQNLYRNTVDDGYLDFLEKTAQTCEFYNFSALNNYTTNSAYYYDWSHYRPIIGLFIEKLLFGTDEEKAQIRKDAGDNLWGIKVNRDNIDILIDYLKGQLR